MLQRIWTSELHLIQEILNCWKDQLNLLLSKFRLVTWPGPGGEDLLVTIWKYSDRVTSHFIYSYMTPCSSLLLVLTRLDLWSSSRGFSGELYTPGSRWTEGCRSSLGIFFKEIFLVEKFSQNIYTFWSLKKYLAARYLFPFSQTHQPFHLALRWFYSVVGKD